MISAEPCRPAWATENLKPCWWYIYSQKNNQSGITALKENYNLHSGYKKGLNPQPSFQYHLYHRPTYPPLSQMLLHVDGIEKLLHEINSSKTAGLDQVPCRFPKELSIKIAPVLTAVFTQSLETPCCHLLDMQHTLPQLSRRAPPARITDLSVPPVPRSSCCAGKRYSRKSLSLPSPCMVDGIPESKQIR